MPQARIKVGDFSDIDAAEGFSDYSGPLPPKGLYNFTVKWWKLAPNKNKDPMFTVLLEIHEPKGSPKAIYNGYVIFHNANITETGAPYLNAMLDAFGIPRKAVYQSKIVLDPEKTERVLKIGGVKVVGLQVAGATQRKEYPPDSDEWKLEVKAFSPAKDGQGVVDGSDEDGEGSEGDEDGTDYSEPDAADEGDGGEDSADDGDAF